jgi:hypothetical protein
MKFYDHTPREFSDECRADCPGCAQKRGDAIDAQRYRCLLTSPRFRDMTVSDAIAELVANGC